MVMARGANDITDAGILSVGNNTHTNTPYHIQCSIEVTTSLTHYSKTTINVINIPQ